MGHRLKAAACFALCLALGWLTFNGYQDAVPVWLVALLACGVAAVFGEGVHQLRLYTYYEGPRTRIVLQGQSTAQRRR